MTLKVTFCGIAFGFGFRIQLVSRSSSFHLHQVSVGTSKAGMQGKAI
jgi:hypothetical protein